MAAPHAISPGTVLGGRYRLDVLLTDHVGARFWRATDTVLARSVAVHAVDSVDPRAAGVLSAARTSATVTDPHFLRVLDCDDDGDRTWVINEWGDGVSLDLMLLRSTLPPTRAAWLAREVAEAMAAAHAQGVNHGRLNPEAVLVTEAGAVKIVGSVINKAFEDGPSPNPRFEHLDGREADVINVAGILYAALVGRWPGTAPSAVPRAPREGRRVLRPRQVRAGVPRALDAICERVLHKEASGHMMPIETAFEIAAALSDYVGDPAAAAPLDVPSMYAEPTVALVNRPDEDYDLSDTGPLAGSPTEPSSPSFRPLERIPAPPPFQDSPERPLFADHQRRVPPGAPPPPPPRPVSGAHAGTTASSRHGTGHTYWPFEEDPASDTSNFTGREGRTWLRLAAIVAVTIVLLAAGFLVFNLTRNDSESPPGQAASSPSANPPVGEPVKIVGASDFDPEGNPPRENPDEVDRAIDGRPDTGWQTLTYRGNPRLGGLKSGVGLVVDLGTERSVGSVELSLVGAPTTLEIYATPAGTVHPPAELADLHQVSNAQNVDSSVVIRPTTELKTRYLLIWLTSLPRVEGGFRGELTEITVRS